MISAETLIRRSAPFLACIGLIVLWQVASLALKNDSFPTALEAIRAIPSEWFKASPAIYWSDFLSSAIVGWAAFVFAVAATGWSRAALFAIAALALYRAVLFIHARL